MNHDKYWDDVSDDLDRDDDEDVPTNQKRKRGRQA